MKNLERKELKTSIKDNILYALQYKKNIDLNINFIFKINSPVLKDNLEYKEKISYFLGIFHFKGVKLSTEVLEKERIIEIILDNLNYDKFAFVSCIKKIGKEQCHGHNEYWGTDDFTFVYVRYY